MKRSIALVGLGLVLFSAVVLFASRSKSPRAAGSPRLLKQVGSIHVPGPKGERFDYLVIDPARRLLFSTHLGAGLLYAIDLGSNKVVKTFGDLPGIEGVEIAPDVNKAYTSNWKENKIGVIDLEQMKLIKKLSTESKPDGIAYAAPFHKIYVSDERGKAEAVVDVRKDEVIATLHFASETGNPRFDPVSRRLYLNLQDRNMIAEIDPVTDKEVAEYPVGRCKGNHGMALDSEHRLAFLSCEDNDLMTVFRLDTHQPIAYFPQAKGGDVIAFDAGLKRIYVACYSGAISVFQEDDPTHFRKLGDVPVQKKVHSLAINPENHRVYAPEQEENGAPAAKIAIFEVVP
ncbi:MAG TPA: YncE family protein [Candidatus Limnocylindrales bacterium]|nr:YncE family protein [Candidatus Limnocylindrales bacterium]